MNPSRHKPSALILLVALMKAGWCAAIPLDLQISGSAKTIANAQFLRHQNIYSKDTVLQGEERLWVNSAITAGTVMLEFTQEASFFAETTNTTAVSVPEFSPRNAWDAEWSLWNSNGTRGIYRIPRLYLQITSGDFEARVGKQVVAIGVGKLFSAVSQLPRLPFTMVDQEYQRGEDALSLKWGKGLVLEGRFLPKVSSQKDHNFHLRAKAQKGGYDIGLTTGRSDDKVFMGLEMAGNLGDDLLRAEIVGFRHGDKDVVQALLGFDHVFNAKWSMTFETFYNGFGDLYDDYQLAYPHRSTPYRGRYYLGATVTWEMSDRLKASLTEIVNLLDPSFLSNLQFNYSLGNNLDLLVGQYLSVSGRPKGEFGGKTPIPVPLPVTLSVGLPDLTYAAMRWYF